MRNTVLLLVTFSSFAILAGECVTGWRNDGSGKYPEAQAPLHWGRTSQIMKGLRCQSAKPAGPEASGQAAADGLLHEWLVLAPVPLPDKPKAFETDTIENELTLEPKAGDKYGELSWIATATEDGFLQFSKAAATNNKIVGYAFTYVYSETGGAYRVNITSPGGTRVIVNGGLAKAFGVRTRLDLTKGWNRLLIKIGAAQEGFCLQAVLNGMAPLQYENKNITWYRTLPGLAAGFNGGGSGSGSLVVCEDKLFLPVEPHDLYCLNKADGRVLWVRSNGYFEALSAEEKKAEAGFAEIEPLQKQLDELLKSLQGDQLDAKLLAEKGKLEQAIAERLKKIDPKRFTRDATDIGFGGYTPVCDGQHVYLWYATGVTACYDLNGTRKWIRIDKRPGIEHGFSSSPILSDGKLIVYMRDLFAFDTKTGSPAWSAPITPLTGANPEGYFHGTPLPFSIANTPLIALGNGTIVRSADGKVLYKNPKMGKQSIASPVLDGTTLLQINTWGMTLFLHALPQAVSDPLPLPTRELSVQTNKFPLYYLHWYMSSPLVHQGLAYLLNNNGVLTVVNLSEAKIAYQKMLDLNQFQSVNEGAFRGVGISPTLAGKHIYIFGNNGGSLIIEPGSEYKEIAKNKIENVVGTGHWSERQERFVANPVFDGKRLYLRSEAGLYAIEE